MVSSNINSSKNFFKATSYFPSLDKLFATRNITSVSFNNDKNMYLTKCSFSLSLLQSRAGYTSVSLTFIKLVTCHSKANLWLCHGAILTCVADILTVTRVSRELTGRCLDGYVSYLLGP